MIGCAISPGFWLCMRVWVWVRERLRDRVCVSASVCLSESCFYAVAVCSAVAQPYLLISTQPVGWRKEAVRGSLSLSGVYIRVTRLLLVWNFVPGHLNKTSPQMCAASGWSERQQFMHIYLTLHLLIISHFSAKEVIMLEVMMLPPKIVRKEILWSYNTVWAYIYKLAIGTWNQTWMRACSLNFD